MNFFYEHRFQYQAIPKSEGVVTKRYKYLRYIDSKPMFEELYDLKTDKYEEHNLARNPRYSDILVEMRKECDILLQAAK